MVRTGGNGRVFVGPGLEGGDGGHGLQWGHGRGEEVLERVRQVALPRQEGDGEGQRREVRLGEPPRALHGLHARHELDGVCVSSRGCGWVRE